MALDRATVERLCRRAEGARWSVTSERFGEALAAAVSGGANPDSLHLEDLALATACADGNDAAWSHFMITYRPILYRAADAIDRSGGARESADAIFGELFGVREKDGKRQSLLRYFHGRSRLDTWLRAVLAQRHVDRIRAARKLDALPDDDGPQPLRAIDHTPDPDQARFTSAMRQALSDAIDGLATRDRLRLRLYYAQQMKLAAIGKMLGEHEATVSRHLTRTRADLRQTVDTMLRQQHGFDDRAVADSFRLIVEDPGTLDLAQLVGAEGGERVGAVASTIEAGKIGVKDRSNG